MKFKFLHREGVGKGLQIEMNIQFGKEEKCFVTATEDG